MRGSGEPLKTFERERGSVQFVLFKQDSLASLGRMTQEARAAPTYLAETPVPLGAANW